jgi:hypothetical protein
LAIVGIAISNSIASTAAIQFVFVIRVIQLRRNSMAAAIGQEVPLRELQSDRGPVGSR